MDFRTRSGIRIGSLPLLTAAAATLVLLAWGWRSGLLGMDAPRQVFLLVMGGLINMFFVAAFLIWHERGTAARRLVEGYQRDLRYVLALATDEAVLRKQILIRDLNALGAVPGNLEQAALPGADLTGVDLHGCSLKGVNLRGADLQGADLEAADLFGADLRGANLSMADLRRANLRSADLSGARLVKAELAGANLQRANLVDANLDGVAMRQAHLHKARFAQREPDALDQTLHPSIDDWIRERLDERGYFSGAGGEPEQDPASPSS